MTFAETSASRLPLLKHHRQFVAVNRWTDFARTVRTVYGYV